MPGDPAKRSFDVDLAALLRVFGGHLYSTPDIFVRELIQNGLDAIPHIVKARGQRDESLCYLLPAIFRLEAAMATGTPEEIRAELRRLRPRVEEHEDAQEAMLGCLRVAQALALLGEDPEDEAHLWAVADRHARRLDARLGRPRHRAEVGQERAEGPPFLAASPASGSRG